MNHFWDVIVGRDLVNISARTSHDFNCKMFKGRDGSMVSVSTNLEPLGSGDYSLITARVIYF